MANLPKVLAGPIVRRVESRSCSFWVALSREATVKALVWKGERNAPVSGADTPVGTGEAKTRTIGAALHVAVVTVDLTGRSRSRPARSTRTTCTFAFTGGRQRRTSRARGCWRTSRRDARIAGVDPVAPLHKALGFEGQACRRSSRRPPTSPARRRGRPAHRALQLPPRRRRQLRRARRDRAARRAGRRARPHQLYLTGDQVYADDIATTFLPLVIALGADVMGGSQPLPGLPAGSATGGTGSTAGDRRRPARQPRRTSRRCGASGCCGSSPASPAATPRTTRSRSPSSSPCTCSRGARACGARSRVRRRVQGPGIPGGAAAPGRGDRAVAEPAVVLRRRRPDRSPRPRCKRDWADPAINKDAFEGFNRARPPPRALRGRHAGAWPRCSRTRRRT